MMNLNEIDRETRAVLAHHGFETIPFAEFAKQLRERGLDLERNRLNSAVELPPKSALKELSKLLDGEISRLQQLGEEAINAGRVGAVILNGGMATRFGGGARGWPQQLPADLFCRSN